eukprot:s2819_g1.t1
MLAAREETDEATKALKDLIDGLGTLTSSLANADNEHGRLAATQVLVTGPPEIVKMRVPTNLEPPVGGGQASPGLFQTRRSPGSSTPVHGQRTPRTPGVVPFKPTSKSLSPPFRSGSRDATPVPVRSPTPTSGPGPWLPAEAEDAVSQARKCLSDVEAQFGYSSKQAIHAATELALQLEELRPATAEAGELLQRALEGSKQAYGEQHLNTLRTANNLAVYLDNIGQKDEALQLYRWARDGRLKQLGATHPYTLDSMYNLASFLFYNGQMADAKEEFIRARDGCVECFGPETWCGKVWVWGVC